jgi:hypothetical protein
MCCACNTYALPLRDFICVLRRSLVAVLEKPLRGCLEAIGAVQVILIGLLVSLGFLAGPKVASEGNALATSLPSLLGQAGRASWFRRWVRSTDGVPSGKGKSRTSSYSTTEAPIIGSIPAFNETRNAYRRRRNALLVALHRPFYANRNAFCSPSALIEPIQP